MRRATGVFYCLALLLHGFLIVDAAKILVYCPSISKSHVLLCAKYADLLHNAAHDTIFREHISPDFPAIREIIRNVSLVLVNTDEIFDISRGYSPKFVYVGLIGADKNENVVLPKNLDEYFSKGKLGSVFVSFGTVTPFQVLPHRIQLSIFNAIQKHPDYHFVIKTSSDDNTTAQLFCDVPNVDFVNWVPQNAILNHKNLKLFVSHGGMNSVLETMYYGVPMVIMPVFTDQFRNGKNVERRGAGRMVLRETVGNETFFDAIDDVLSDERYQISAKRISHLMKNRPFTPEERVSKWINFVLEHDTAEHFHLESNSLSFIEHNHLDIIFMFLVLPLITIFVYIRVAKHSMVKTQ